MEYTNFLLSFLCVITLASCSNDNTLPDNNIMSFDGEIRGVLRPSLINYGPEENHNKYSLIIPTIYGINELSLDLHSPLNANDNIIGTYNYLDENTNTTNKYYFDFVFFTDVMDENFFTTAVDGKIIISGGQNDIYTISATLTLQDNRILTLNYTGTFFKS